MTTTGDLVRRETDTWVDVLPAVGDLAGKIAGTDFVPDAMRGKPASVAAAILYGREIGLAPMQSLHSISVIKGKPTLSAEAMRAMVLAAGHQMRFVEMTNTRCVIEARRAGDSDTTVIAYSMDDAKRAGLAGQQQYQKMPRQMLVARATSEACRLVFPDIVAGFISEVEARDPVPWDESAPVTVQAEPAKRTAKRATTPTRPRPAAKPVPAAEPVEVDEPPLDDEPEVDSETGEIVDAEIVEDEPTPMVTEKQLTAIAAGMTACGWKDRADRLRLASAVAGRELASSKELTRVEAGELLDALAYAQNTDDPQTALIGLIEAARGEES